MRFQWPLVQTFCDLRGTHHSKNRLITMPTLTLSWTDLALFGLTAGLIGGIVLIGRSNSSSNGITASSDQKKSNNSSSKKKKKAKKGESGPSPAPPSTSSVVKRQEITKKTPSPPEPVSTPQSIPDSPPTPEPEVVVESKPSPDPSSAPFQKVQKKKAGKKHTESINHQDFPPLVASKDETNNKSNQPKPKRPFAETHQRPVPKTIVDDMIDEDVEKPLKMARVMNILGPEPDVPLSPTSDPEDGWEKVPDSKRSRTNGITITIGSSSSAAPTSKPKPVSDGATSKRQRQNAKKKEAAKAQKAAEEAERLSHLSSHKREQERIRMNAQTRSPQPNPTSTKPSGKKIASASVAEDGRLIWE
ncbi:hypothetical protein KEM48_009778 [Puccinia striiformis f. sp. tritici PST-130]|nr:hypothetical protein KEM48_009778 [Puccinia striiformis f. sp. tritici PST-130]